MSRKKKCFPTLLFLFFVPFILAGQTKTPVQDLHLLEVEDYILGQQLDSAGYLLSQIREGNQYVHTLKQIVQGEPSLRDYLDFVASFDQRFQVDYRQLNDFIVKNVYPPEKKGAIDMDYVELKWKQVSNVSNELQDLNLANLHNGELEDYIAQFNSNDRNTKRAAILASVHRMVLSDITQNLDRGMEIALESERIAREIQDTTLVILSLYHQCDFLYYQNDFEKYIQLSEEAYRLDKELDTRSFYFVGNLRHLVFAYLKTGVFEPKVKALLDEMYDIPRHQAKSFYLYVDLAGNLPNGDPLRQEVFEKFGAANLEELGEIVLQRAENTLSANDTYLLLNRLIRVFSSIGNYDQALAYSQKAVDITRKTYGLDLSRALSRYETGLVTKEKEKEVALEKERTKTSIAIAGGVSVLLILAILANKQKQRQNHKIREKSDEIELQRDAITKQNEEKELLLQEIHHRVKNNLQVVSSLLDLQSRGIENEEALATFTEGQNRVKAMALIHQKLYQAENLATINFEEYTRLLMGELATIYQKGNGVRAEVHVGKQADFDIDTAVPLGLILNELISNSYKYAFEGKSDGLLSISIETMGDGKHQLVVQDNGSGLPSDFDFAKAKSLGLRLVRRLAKQLYGSVTYSGDEGARFVITFTDTLQRKTT